MNARTWTVRTSWMGLAAVIASGTVASTAQAQCPPEILSPDPTTEYAEVKALSSDGRIAVGLHKVAGKIKSYRWTDVGVGQFLSLPTGNENFANDMSADGGVVVGQTYYPGSGTLVHAFRWTQAKGMKVFGTDGKNSSAVAVSGNGLVTVGFDWDPAHNIQAATVWTEGGATKTLVPAGSLSSAAHAVNHDGTVIALSAFLPGPGGKPIQRVYRWTEPAGMVPLEDLGGDEFNTAIVEDMSSDGEVLVGVAWTPDGIFHAARWVNGVIDVISGDIPNARAGAITSDGEVVMVSSDTDVYLWTEESGLQVVPSSGGVANAVSDVGFVYAGSIGKDGAPWDRLAARWGSRADCDRSSTLTIDDFICFQTLFALGEVTADCDSDGVLSIDDFVCFQTEFALGC